MRVLMIHNRYRQRGGEDESVRLEIELLRQAGHDVEEYGPNNDEVDATSSAALRAIWNPRSYRHVRTQIRLFRPDIVHVQNFFAVVSPAVHYAASRAGVPVVQTLRNYRLLCCNASLFRQGAPCDLCVARSVPWPGVKHGCYRRSVLMSAAVASNIAVHHVAGTWRTRVACYVVPSEFMKSVFVRAGFDHARILVKPNFLSPAPVKREVPGQYYHYVGRLSEEKGVLTLLRAVALAQSARLRIVGDGPLLSMLRSEAERLRLRDRIQFAGQRDHEATIKMIGEAKAVVVPSEWDEPFGRVVIEAYACGVPVIGSRRGAITELVRDGVTGLHFSPGDAVDLASKIESFEGDPAFGARAGLAAKVEFDAKYTAARNYEMLMAIYAQAIATHNSSARVPAIPDVGPDSSTDGGLTQQIG